MKDKYQVLFNAIPRRSEYEKRSSKNRYEPFMGPMRKDHAQKSKHVWFNKRLRQRDVNSSSRARKELEETI